jgi:16S rRNA (guanine966-N2)-methyltransferase
VSELRITGGELGGRRIAAPAPGSPVRPTSERAREAVFSILGAVTGARVLDVFCGTGALAIEALSRGAAEATLVDTDARLARENVDRLGLEDRARAIRSDAARFLRRAPEGAFDLVLCDPPYGPPARKSPPLGPLLARALAPGGRLMVESSPEAPLAVDLPLLRERAYGDTLVRVHVRKGR